MFLFRELIKLSDFFEGAFQVEQSNKTRLMNILLQLRKCCCHPYIFPGLLLHSCMILLFKPCQEFSILNTVPVLSIPNILHYPEKIIPELITKLDFNFFATLYRNALIQTCQMLAYPPSPAPEGKALNGCQSVKLDYLIK